MTLYGTELKCDWWSFFENLVELPELYFPFPKYWLKKARSALIAFKQQKFNGNLKFKKFRFARNIAIRVSVKSNFFADPQTRYPLQNEHKSL